MKEVGCGCYCYSGGIEGEAVASLVAEKGGDSDPKFAEDREGFLNKEKRECLLSNMPRGYQVGGDCYCCYYCCSKMHRDAES